MASRSSGSVADHLAQRIDITATEVALPIDENGRGAGHTIRLAAPNVSLYARGEPVCRQRSAEGFGGDASCCGLPLETRRLEVVLIGEQGIVHDPKYVGAAECVDCLGRLRGHRRMRMDLAQRGVAKHVTERICAVVAKLRDG